MCHQHTNEQHICFPCIVASRTKLIFLRDAILAAAFSPPSHPRAPVGAAGRCMRPALRVLHRLTTTVDLSARDAVPRATAHTARPTANRTHGVLRNLHRAMTAQAQATTSPTHGASVGNAAACDPPACGTYTTGTEPIAESNPVASTSGGKGLPTPPHPRPQPTSSPRGTFGARWDRQSSTSRRWWTRASSRSGSFAAGTARRVRTRP